MAFSSAALIVKWQILPGASHCAPSVATYSSKKDYAQQP
jgi:hypothetical protein